MLTLGYTLEECCELSYNLNIKAHQDSLCEAVSLFFFILFFIMMFQCIINHFGRGLCHYDASTEMSE